MADMSALKLPVRPEPHVPWETNAANWVCANGHGATFGDNRDDTATIQAAVDAAAAAAAGKTTVYVRGIRGGDPNWYNLDGEVCVHGTVRSIVGLRFGRVLGRDKGRFVIDDRSAPVVRFIHLQAFGGRPPMVENRSAFDIVDAEFSAAGMREISFGNTHPVKARERRGGEIHTQKGGGGIGWALFRSGTEIGGPR